MSNRVTITTTQRFDWRQRGWLFFQRDQLPWLRRRSSDELLPEQSVQAKTPLGWLSFRRDQLPWFRRAQTPRDEIPDFISSIRYPPQNAAITIPSQFVAVRPHPLPPEPEVDSQESAWSRLRRHVPIIPSIVSRAIDIPLVPRVPTEDQRLRRFTDVVSTMLNSLLRQGFIVQKDVPLTFALGPAGAISIARAPTVADDSTAGYRVGNIWVDTVHDHAYVAISVSAGAAVWSQID